MGGVEAEVRSLPGVVACSVTATRVAVLVAPDADPADMARAIRGVLAGAHLAREVRILGGQVTPLSLPPPATVGASAGVAGTAGRLAGRRTGRPTPVMASTAAGVAVLAAAALVAALTGGGPDGGRPTVLGPRLPATDTGIHVPSSRPRPAPSVLSSETTAVVEVAGRPARHAGGTPTAVVAVAASSTAPSVTPAPAPAPAPGPSATPATPPSRQPVVTVAAAECGPPPPPRAHRHADKANGPGDHGRSSRPGACDPPSQGSWPGHAGLPS
jgi:hypothetical protein